MSKKSIIILGTEYSSVAKAADVLKVSKSSLYRLIKIGTPIDPVIPNLQGLFGKKKAKRSIIVDGKKYDSLNEAARFHDLDNGAFFNAAKGKTEVDAKLLKKLKHRKRGYHARTILVNGRKFNSITDAAEFYACSRALIERNIKTQRSDELKIDFSRQLKITAQDKKSLSHLRSLAEECGLKSLQDWYTKRREAMKGYGLVQKRIRDYWEGDIIDVLQKLFPTEEIQWWKFHKAPNGTYKRRELRWQYMNWLEGEKNYKQEEDWYKIDQKDFADTGGANLVAYMGSIYDLVKDMYSGYEWKPWLFEVAPNGCWKNRGNHRKFLDYVAEKEKWTQPEDWYKVTRATFTRHKGVSLLKLYDSLFHCIETNYPDYDLKFWLMKSSRGNWEEKANKRKYLEWLGEKLCFTNLDDWYGVIEEDFSNNHGSTLLSKVHSGGAAKCVMAVFDEHDWQLINFRGANQWKTQLRLYNIVRCALSNMEVEREYPVDALSMHRAHTKQRLDVFISDQDNSVSLAIEYHGRQHYEWIKHFHKTKKEFQDAQKRDQIKKNILQEVGVPLVEIKYSSWKGNVVYILDILNKYFGLSIRESDVREEAKKTGLFDSIFLESNTKSARETSSLTRPEPVTIAKILELADACYKKYKIWPKKRSGVISSENNLTWNTINNQLLKTEVGSLANLLFLERDVHHHLKRNKLTIYQIIEWAKDHFKKTNEWPTYKSGAVLADYSEKWGAINSALQGGHRGLETNETLEALLWREKGVVGTLAGKKLSNKKILDLTKQHFEKTGLYPTSNSDWILEGKDSWSTISVALNRGFRGLPGGSSLAKLLHAHNLKANLGARKYPSKEEIVEAAKEYKTQDKNSKLPTSKSGPFPNPNYLDLTWGAINSAIAKGSIEYTKAKTLTDLWVLEFGSRNINNLEDLSEEQILQWCDKYQEDHPNKKFPSNQSVPIVTMGTETFMSIDTAIRENRRGLTGLVSLAHLLFKKRGKRTNKNLPKIKIKQIKVWMIAWHNHYQKWPTASDGEIPNTGGEKWSNINATLHRGGRGWPKTSLAKLKEELEDRQKT